MGLFGSRFGSISKFTRYTGLSAKEEFDKNVDSIKKKAEPLAHFSANDMISIVDDNMDRILMDSAYCSAKIKVFSRKYYEVNKEEFVALAAAIKSAENNLYRFGVEQKAYYLRRFLYHAEELGLPEFKALVLKYKGSFL